MRHIEKRAFLLQKMGSHLLGQRQAVFRETQEQFAQRLALFGEEAADVALVQALESGNPAVSIASWMCAWQVMQIADAVVQASKSDAALFLAAARHAPGIEQEIAHELNKRESS